MKQPVLTGLTLALALAAGCASTPPARYYTLSMLPSGHPPAPVNLVIDRLRTVESLARKELLIKKSPTEIEYYASDQWAAGLDELVTEKLLEEFGAAPADQASVILSGLIQAFEQVDTPEGALAHVKLMVEFRKERYGGAVLTKTYDATAATARPDPSAVVVGLSQCLERIAQDIAADAAAL